MRRLTQLVNLCIGPEGLYLEKFLGRISFAHPHAIYFSLRTHYHCLRLEFTEKSMFPLPLPLLTLSF